MKEENSMMEASLGYVARSYLEQKKETFLIQKPVLLKMQYSLRIQFLTQTTDEMFSLPE